MSVGDDRPFVIAAQTYSYLKSMAKGIDIECPIDPSMKYLANNGVEWRTPALDLAGWYSPDVPGSENFLGGIVSEIKGLFDSTQETSYSDLKGDGAVHNARRFGVREIYIKMTLFSLSDLGMTVGLDWLKDTLSGGFCGNTRQRSDCYGDELIFLRSKLVGSNVNDVAASYFARSSMVKDVRTLQGVKILRTVPFKGVEAIEVEFILLAANPFIFRLVPEWSLNATGITPATAPEVKCNIEANSYAELITDPNDGAVARPPRPPLINPTPMPATWNRRNMTAPASKNQQWGQIVTKVTVSASNVQRMLRLRFYREGYSGCDYDGEFLITYIPEGDTLIIDGTDNSIMMIRSTGKVVPASNLVVGSDGRPATWPVVDCKTSYRVQVDLPDSLSGIDVTVEGFIRR